ncbi:MAG: HAMP domain-containing sensor histidine kinase [Bacteroidota bacterium]|nr:HAMP domain-containing sensor histidine kinase [Bacteroidota bacterium]
MQKKMIAILAQDIRGPLHSLKSLLQLIPENKTGLSQPGLFLEMAGHQLNATLSLLDNMVEWGQLELDGEVHSYTSCRLREIVRQIEREMEGQARLKGLHLVNRVDDAIVIETDESRLRFILRNLVSNAIKFTRAGTVAVDAALGQKSVLISVEDTGIGMPADLLEQLFHGTKNVSRKGTGNEAGSGHGLSLVKEFVAKINGRITAESEVGKGSAIALSLPRFSPRSHNLVDGAIAP